MNGLRSAALLALLVGLTLPPEVLAARFVEETISFTTADGLVLKGIVSHPKKGEGPFPALLLIAGSGLHDADLTIDIPEYRFTHGEQKHFRGLARFFSRKGMTVLRYNKRGASFDHASDQPALLWNSTFDDLVSDAESAYHALRSHSLADPERMAILGISEGTMVAPRVAQQVRTARLVVMVASASSTLEEILRFQSYEIFRLFLELAADADGDGYLTLEELDRLDGDYGRGSFWIGNIASLLFSLSGSSVVGFNNITDRNGDGRLHIEDEVLVELERFSQDTIDAWRSGTAAGRYGQSLFFARPNRELVAKVRTPMLFCHGELDFQAPVSEALHLIEVLESKNLAYEALFFPLLGHTLSKPNDFFKGDGGLTILDNPTGNAMRKPTMRRILKRVRALLSN